ncbi:uncharacterized protein LOC128883530 isoform X2 [Hylaeus volcanicus]|uniref:uncharacterized protein LOC128883530 isoform X2 n=1 Tax=Hylaeus volcanicus TaxID=313075 RepID=UPI0023B879D1|nr:uncharacterized protein LOC128883530 isoform X2 [Hylaeus volcanicus]
MSQCGTSAAEENSISKNENIKEELPINQCIPNKEDTPNPLEENSLRKTKETELSPTAEYGLEGMLKAVRLNNVDLNMLAVGTDLTSLGLNLNVTENLSTSFTSPILDGQPSKEDFEFTVSGKYYVNCPPLKMTRLQAFLPETLFYIFYTMVGSVLQGYVAAELYNRKWVYHNNFRKWFTTVVLQKQNDANEKENNWIYFEPMHWKKKFYSGYIDISEFMKPNELKTLLANVKQEPCPPVNPSWNETSTLSNPPHIPPNNIPNSTALHAHELSQTNNIQYYGRPPVQYKDAPQHISLANSNATPPGFGHVTLDKNYNGVLLGGRPLYSNVNPSFLQQFQKNVQQSSPELTLNSSHLRYN